MSFVNDLKLIFAKFPQIKVAILFGSFCQGNADQDSDLDIAVAAAKPLSPEEKMSLIEELAQFSGRPVDLIDLQTAGGLILHRALTRGQLLHCTDRSLYAEIIKKMLFHQADFMPYRRRILAQRRSAWITN
ncbi:MAG: nucleotidyltransferase domain-containing protein [Pseudomonadota bacterium]